MAEALVRRGRAAEEGGWEIEMTALRRLGREEVHMMNSSAQYATLLPLKQLDFRPASFFVVQHVKKTYACRSCDGPGERRFTTAGPAVLGPIPKGLPGPGLLAHLLTCKYADHLPLHRQVGIVARSGVRLSR